MEVREIFYIFDDQIESLEIREADGKLYLDEELEVEVTFDSEGTSHFASWWEDCDEGYTSTEVFFEKEHAVHVLKTHLSRKIDHLQKRLAALES